MIIMQMTNNDNTIFLNNSSKNFKTGIPILVFLNTEKPVLKKDTGFEHPSI
jgi:hypothetical protein